MTLPKERGIIMSSPMVQAIMRGDKTKTRRMTGLEFVNEAPDHWQLEGIEEDKAGRLMGVFKNGSFAKICRCRYGKPGDLLWVRETFACQDETYFYKAHFDDHQEQIRKQLIAEGYQYQWTPAIHMPKVAARIWLEVRDVSVERVQSITRQDAIAEGVESIEKFPLTKPGKRYYRDYRFNKLYLPCEPTHSFKTLWLSINGDESWEKNVWTWVVTFRILSTDGEPQTKQSFFSHQNV